MSDVLIAPVYTLTDEDVRLIVEVCAETAKEGGAVALVRGPETQAALAKWFPQNKTWAGLQKLGTIRQSGNAAKTGSSGRPANRFQKRIERVFVGSKRWPKGLPMGCTEIHTQAEMYTDTYRLEKTAFDVVWDQYDRLRFMSMGRRKLTQHELQADMDRKEALRSNRAEIEATTTPEQRAAAAAADQTKALVRELLNEMKGGSAK